MQPMQFGRSGVIWRACVQYQEDPNGRRPKVHEGYESDSDHDTFLRFLHVINQ